MSSYVAPDAGGLSPCPQEQVPATPNIRQFQVLESERRLGLRDGRHPSCDPRGGGQSDHRAPRRGGRSRSRGRQLPREPGHLPRGVASVLMPEHSQIKRGMSGGRRRAGSTLSFQTRLSLGVCFTLTGPGLEDPGNPLHTQ